MQPYAGWERKTRHEEAAIKVANEVIHYHGTPITPLAQMLTLHGKCFCVSFAEPWDIHRCLKVGQSVMLDNGAFSVWRRGLKPNWPAYYRWVEDKLNHPHWAIVPDVIGGTEEENLALIAQWPHRKDVAAVVWHTNESMDQLLRLVDCGFRYLCFGSTQQYRPGSAVWDARMDEAFATLERAGARPWVHMLRGLSQAGRRWPFASADSTNVAQNWKRNGKRTGLGPRGMADTIDGIQCPVFYIPQYDSSDHHTSDDGKDLHDHPVQSDPSHTLEAWSCESTTLAQLQGPILVSERPGSRSVETTTGDPLQAPARECAERPCEGGHLGRESRHVVSSAGADVWPLCACPCD